MNLTSYLNNALLKALNKFKLSFFEGLIKHSFWAVFGSVLSKGVMLISSIFLARVLDQAEYGELGIIRSSINMFVVFAGFGIGNTTSRYIALHKGQNILEARRIFDVSFLFILFVAIFLSLGVFLYAKDLSIISFNESNLENALQVSAILLFFATINGAYSGSLAGFQDFKSIAKNTFISSLTQAILLIIGSIYYGVIGCLLGYGLGYFLLFWLHRRAVKRNFGDIDRIIGIKNFLSTDKSFIWSYSLPAALSSFLVTPVFWWCKSFMIRSTNFTEMAHFDVADQWRMIVLFIPSALAQIILPTLTSDKDNFKKILKFNLLSNIAIIIIILIPLLILSKYILSLYGEDYVNVELFSILLVSTVFSSFCSVIGSALASLGIMWKGFTFNLFWAFYLIGFTIVLINHNLGALGLAYAVLLSYFIHGITQFIYLKFYLNIFNK